MNHLAEKYVSEIEGFIPDLCAVDSRYETGEPHDAVQDFAGDYIFHKERCEEHRVDHAAIKEAAGQIADYYFGETK